MNSFQLPMHEHKKLRHTLEHKTMREQKPPFDFMDTGYKGQGFPVYSLNARKQNGVIDPS